MGRLLALGMELPEETFVNIHGFDAKGETYGTIRSRSLSRPPRLTDANAHLQSGS